MPRLSSYMNVFLMWSMIYKERLAMRFMRFVLSLVVFPLILLPVRTDEAENVMKSINAGDIFEFNKILASPAMQGRLPVRE